MNLDWRSIEQIEEDNLKAKKQKKVTEKQLERFLIKHIYLVEDKLKYLEHQRETGYGIIDILCEDENENFVVIELKIGRTSECVVAQIQRYMVWVEKNFGIRKGMKPVRGIIIAESFDVRTRIAILGSRFNIELKTIEILSKYNENDNEVKVKLHSIARIPDDFFRNKHIRDAWEDADVQKD